MGRKIEEQKQTVSKLKAERDKIAMDINAGKAQIEELEKDRGNIKNTIKISKDTLNALGREEQKLTDRLKVIIGDIGKRNAEKAVIESQISDKEKTLKSLEKSGDLFIEKEKQRIKDELAVLNGLLMDRKDESGKLEQAIKGQEKVKIELMQEIDNKKTEIREIDNKLLGLNQNVCNAEIKNIEVQDKIDKLLPVKKELENVKQLRDDVKNEVSATQNEIKVTQEVLGGLKKEVLVRTLVVKKKEDELGRKAEDLSRREELIKDNEKRIKKLGDTLQKHFDNNDMKHIKVFNQ